MKQELYDDVFDVTKITNYALKMVIDEKLNSLNDILNEIEDGDSGNGTNENPNRNGWILYMQHASNYTFSEYIDSLLSSTNFYAAY